MCEAVGLTCTGHFSSNHDVLICRKADGTKYQKAREWRKPVVTLNWLNELHFGFINALQQVHHPKYQHFNLPAYVQDPLKFELKMAATYLAAWRVPIKVTQEMLLKCRQANVRQSLLKNGTAAAGAESAAGDGPLRKKAKLDAAAVGDEEDDDKLDKSSSSNLDAVLDDVAKGGFDDDGKPRPMIRFSGFKETAHLAKAVARFGASLAATNKQTTHLVMAKVVRTPKLLCCLPTVSFIVSPQWVTDSAHQAKLLGTSD